MKIKYDFHIHSALSPCADNDMTPVNIVAYAKFNGLDMIAVADHNAIENVETAIAAGKAYGVTVVPAVEVQTAEDIHVLCLFKTFEQLKNFVQPEDILIALSSSGNSKNIIKAIEYANQNNITTIGLTGCDGGKLKQIAKFSVNANINDKQIAEDIHLVLCHLLMQISCAQN